MTSEKASSRARSQHMRRISPSACRARDRDNAMAEARHKLDWPAQFALALDPEKAQRFYEQVPPTERHTCSMCGKMCAVRTTNMILEGKKVEFCSEKGSC